MNIKFKIRLMPVVLAFGVALVALSATVISSADPHDKGKGNDKNACKVANHDKGKDNDKGPSSIPNNHPFKNPGGAVATFSTQGSVDLTSDYFIPQGTTNNRSCATCHTAENAWGISACTVQQLFDETGGTHPIFNLLDADNPNADVSTVEARRAAYSMLLTRGDFRRGTAIPAGSEWDVITADDPHGFANLTRVVEWRRSLPTMNFPLGTAIILWNGGNSRPPFPAVPDQHAGLEFQVPGNITGNGGPLPSQAVIDNIVNFESSLFTAQINVKGVGRLDSDGAQGGPEALSLMTKTTGRFNLFDAWAHSDNPKRVQIYRGQELFNNPNLPSGNQCGGCHNSANNGTNTNDTLFLNIGTASVAARTPDLPLYTFRNKTTLATVQCTDAGRGRITGLYNDLCKFKVPTLRGLAARPPYFHNGIAATLDDVVLFYEANLGFVFTDQERADLVAFMNAL